MWDNATSVDPDGATRRKTQRLIKILAVCPQKNENEKKMPSNNR